MVPPMRSDGPGGKRPRRVPLAMIVLSLVIILIGLLVLSARQPKPHLASVPALVVFLLLTFEIGSGIVGCIGGGGSHSQPGRCTVTVSGSNQGVTRAINLNLTVDCPR